MHQTTHQPMRRTGRPIATTVTIRLKPGAPRQAQQSPPRILPRLHGRAES